MWVDTIQNSKEWFDLRIGKITSSNFDKIMANEGKSFGVPAVKYARKVALEIVTNKRDEASGFTSKLMERGNELEPVARELYEINNFITVTNGGFFYSKRFGDSNDGNIGDNGGAEIKCVIANTQWDRIEKGGYNLSYKWQIQGHIMQGKKQWIDFISYCPEMPENKKLYVFRVVKDVEMQGRLKLRLNKFKELVDTKVSLLK